MSEPLVELAPGTLLLRGGDLGCARLLILLGRAVRELPDRTVVQLETTDPVAPIDLPAWCRLTGHDYLGPVPPGGSGEVDPSGGPPRYAVRVSARAIATDPRLPWRPAPSDRP